MEPVQATPTERTLRFARDVQAELKKVVWPTQQQLVAFTVIVLASTIAVGLFLLLFAFLFHAGIQVMVP